jgi:hypothetical protein
MPCSSQRLSLAWVTRGEFSFHSLNIFGLTNSGNVPCTLHGFPTVGLYNSAGQRIQVRLRYQKTNADWPQLAAATVTLAPRHVAGLYIEGIANPDPPGPCTPLRNVTVRLALPSQPSSATLSSTITPGICQGENLYISPIVANANPPKMP